MSQEQYFMPEPMERVLFEQTVENFHMKITLCSDLHLEHGDIVLSNTGSDVLILGGDICEYRNIHKFHEFFSRCVGEFPHVIFIAGNHELYYGDFHATINQLYDYAAKFPNLYFLENDTKIIEGVVFVGSTLWTDCSGGDPLCSRTLVRLMNDFHIISVGRGTDHPHALRPEETIEKHKESLKYIGQTLQQNTDARCVVVTHHAPTPLSIHPRYKRQKHMNGGFVSDLSEFILDYPQIKLWTHGHTHDTHEYMIGTTKVLCNPRGYYPHEVQSKFFREKSITI